jgi:hypothetical protein
MAAQAGLQTSVQSLQTQVQTLTADTQKNTADLNEQVGIDQTIGPSIVLVSSMTIGIGTGFGHRLYNIHLGVCIIFIRGFV